MARTRRLKIMGDKSFYHIISRTVGQEFYFGEVEKEKLVQLIKYYSNMYLVKVLGFVIMSNHFHLVIKSEPNHKYSDNDILDKIKKYVYKNKTIPSYINQENLIEKYRIKLEDISEYVRAIKQMFSRWYNKANNRSGYLWGDRFKSVLLEDGNSLMTCLAYIELNPIRAGLVKLPEDYRWCSLSYRVGTKNRDNFLSFSGLFDDTGCSEIEKLTSYRYHVYKAGNMKRITQTDIEGENIEGKRPRIKDEVYDEEINRGFALPKTDQLNRRIRYFSDGLVIGSKGFIQQMYNQFGGEIILKKDRKAHKTNLGNTILSLRRLNI